MNLTHLDENNRPKMVDVGDKDITTRIAIASGVIEVSQDAYNMAMSNNNKKGLVIQTAIIAGIMGATNALTFTTDLLGDVTIVGPGAGRIETGFSILTDLIDIHRKK